MEHKETFTENMLSAIASHIPVMNNDKLIEAVHGRSFMKVVMAVRAWFRHMALQDRPELMVKQSPRYFEVYGGNSITRDADGSLTLRRAGKICNARFIEVSSISNWLARSARMDITRHYMAQVEAMVSKQAWPEEFIADAIQFCSDLSDYFSDNPTVNWWRRKSSMASDTRVIGKLLWAEGVIDKDVYSVAIKIGGFKHDMVFFNSCAKNLKAIQLRIAEAPNMAPLLITYESAGFVAMNCHENVWKDLKTQFIAKGLTPQAWKWLSNQGSTWIQEFSRTQQVACINAIAGLQLGKIPCHRPILNELRHYIIEATYKAKANPVSIKHYLNVFKAAMLAYKKRKLKVSDMTSSILIFDWMRAQTDATLNTDGATWASLMRKQAKWHDKVMKEEAEKRRSSGICKGWQPIVQYLEQGALQAISLNNSDELWEEGTAMRHCVGGYDDKCFSNQARIYSIRKDGARFATLELEITKGSYSVRQLYGVRNSKITDKTVIQFARKLRSACSKAPQNYFVQNEILRHAKDIEGNPIAYDPLADEIPF